MVGVSPTSQPPTGGAKTRWELPARLPGRHDRPSSAGAECHGAAGRRGAVPGPAGRTHAAGLREEPAFRPHGVHERAGGGRWARGAGDGRRGLGQRWAPTAAPGGTRRLLSGEDTHGRSRRVMAGVQQSVIWHY